jgi:hypothetical protein
MSYARQVDADCVQEACEYMRYATLPFITPISYSADHDYGEMLGSATIVELHGARYLLTCEHVARRMTHYRLAHFTRNDEPAAAVINPFQCEVYPVDLALARIDDVVFADMDKQALPAIRLSPSFDVAKGEIVFIHGYPGERGRFSALSGGLRATTFPYAACLCDLPPGYEPDKHFAVSFPDTLSRYNGNECIRPNPEGLSGSAVWNTKYVECATELWAPSASTVIGVLFGYDENYQCLVGTRIETVRMFLLNALRHEAAYFRWHENRSPPDTELADWSWACSTISTL